MVFSIRAEVNRRFRNNLLKLNEIHNTQTRAADDLAGTELAPALRIESQYGHDHSHP